MSQSGRNSSLKYNYDNYQDDFEESPSVLRRQLKKVSKQQAKSKQKYDEDFIAQSREGHSKLQYSGVKLQPIVGGSDREKLIEHNIKLKTQIYELTKQMDDILSRDKVKKRRQITEEDDQGLRSRKLELKKQQLQIQQLKNKITLVKRQLQNVYDNRTIISKQDNLKMLKSELKSLEQQKSALVKIKRQQNKALKSMKNQTEYQSKIAELKVQLSKVKQQSKQLSQKLVENERILRRNHEQYIIKQNRIKQMQQKMSQNKQKEKGKKIQAVISPEMIEELQEQIDSLQKQKKDVERHWQQKIALIDQQLHQKRQQQQRKLLILKQKQKQLKLNQMKIKQLKKLIKHNGTQIKKKTEEPSDPKEFRYKRNIKYLDSNR